MRQEYLNLIDKIVDQTLKGKIRSKNQVYQMLIKEITLGTGEQFEYCLQERLTANQTQLSAETDELKQAKATRIMRALQTIQGEWEQIAKQQQSGLKIAQIVTQIINSGPGKRLSILINSLDPNLPDPLKIEQITELNKALRTKLTECSTPELILEIQAFSTGMSLGIKSFDRLSPHLISWIYTTTQMGFEADNESSHPTPWKLWSQEVEYELYKKIFQTLGSHQSLLELITQTHINVSDWIGLALLLQLLQTSLVIWFEKQPYNSQFGTRAAISTLLTFSTIWGQVSNIITDKQLGQQSFQIALQILRTFAQKPYFPLYGGIFALFSKSSLNAVLQYLDEPLSMTGQSQEKARILTLLGYTQQTLGKYDQARQFYQQALELAQTSSDRQCEIATLNHLSRTLIQQKKYQEAITYSQRALILARQTGDRQGEANALSNYGSSEVLTAKSNPNSEIETYENAIYYLEQGLELAQKIGEQQAQALCYNSLGVAYLILEQPKAAITYLTSALENSTYYGDLYLQGLNYAYLLEAYLSLDEVELALYAGTIATYLLHQIQAFEWTKCAGLVIMLLNQVGNIKYQQILIKYRSKIIPVIGIDGYDYIPQILAQYQKNS